MKTWQEWFELAQATVRTTADKAREIASICYADAQSGGLISTWHASSIVHQNEACACYHCKHGVY